jgi:hypothetical protein
MGIREGFQDRVDLVRVSGSGGKLHLGVSTLSGRTNKHEDVSHEARVVTGRGRVLRMAKWVVLRGGVQVASGW